MGSKNSNSSGRDQVQRTANSLEQLFLASQTRRYVASSPTPYSEDEKNTQGGASSTDVRENTGDSGTLSFWSSADQCEVSNATYGSEAEYVSEMVKQSFESKPKETATAILESISEIDRIHLLLALQSKASKANIEVRDREYIDEIIKSIRSSSDEHHLSRGEIANALAYQRMLQRYNSHSNHPPTWKQLSRVIVAAGLPFVGFGFTDNAVMLLAGEAIDHWAGLHMGITTLAAAGLGNIAADVVGVSVTHQIKEKSRKISWAQPPRLSTLQQAMKSVRNAKMAGAALGVTVGCLMGMLPLAFTDPGFFDEHRSQSNDEMPLDDIHR